MNIEKMEGDCDECGEEETKLKVIDIGGYNQLALCDKCVKELIKQLRSN